MKYKRLKGYTSNNKEVYNYIELLKGIIVVTSKSLPEEILNRHTETMPIVWKDFLPERTKTYVI